MNVLQQVNVRDENFWEKTPGLSPLYTVGAIHSLLMVPLHVLWSALMLVVFLRDLQSLQRVSMRVYAWGGRPSLKQRHPSTPLQPPTTNSKWRRRGRRRDRSGC